MEGEKEYREEKEKLAAATEREEMILEKKRMKQAERQRRKEEEGKEEEAVKLKVHILEENEENENSSISSSSSSPLQSPVKSPLKRMKRRIRTGVLCDGVRVTQRNSQLENYRLSFSDLPDSLQKELTKMKMFLTRRRLGPQPSTHCERHGEQIRRAHTRYLRLARENEWEYKVEDLKSLSMLFPSMKESAADAFDYLQYLTVERHLGKLRIAHHEKLHSCCKVYVRR